MGYRVYDLARQGTTVDLFGPDAFSIENGKKDGVYHITYVISKAKMEALSHRIVIQHPSI
jgi:hypothetical protein